MNSGELLAYIPTQRRLKAFADLFVDFDISNVKYGEKIALDLCYLFNQENADTLNRHLCGGSAKITEEKLTKFESGKLKKIYQLPPFYYKDRGYISRYPWFNHRGDTSINTAYLLMVLWSVLSAPSNCKIDEDYTNNIVKIVNAMNKFKPQIIDGWDFEGSKEVLKNAYPELTDKIWK